MRESGIGPWINFGREVGKLFRPMEICHFFFFWIWKMILNTVRNCDIVFLAYRKFLMKHELTFSDYQILR